MAGIYIHIPFCKQACHYCDFHFSTSLQHRGPMVEALCQELLLRPLYLAGGHVQTVYLGGGTPSLLTSAELASLLETIHTHYRVQHPCEVTLEANPDDITPAHVHRWKQLGINRLSIGVQTFQEPLLQQLNRAHSRAQALRCVPLAHDAGMANISLDLIYALPQSSVASLAEDIAQAVALSPQHISIYGLTIEEKTVFGKQQKKGTLKTVPEAEEAAQFELLMDRLPEAGYEQYEISNFARPGYHSRHNSNYWKGEHYLGIGPSAHSFNGTTRQYNVAHNGQYETALREHRIPATIETLTRANQINEYLFTRLRTQWGVDLHELAERWNYHLPVQQAAAWQQAWECGWLQQHGTLVTLTRKGKLLADAIASNFFAE